MVFGYVWATKRFGNIEIKRRGSVDWIPLPV